MLLNVVVQIGDKALKIQTNLVGEYNLPNVLLAFAVGSFFGIYENDIKVAIESYEPDNSRSQFVEMGHNKIILDAYNANPTSMRAAITNFFKIDGDKVLMLGAMKEMGDDELKEHRELIEFIQQWKWKSVVLVGSEFEPVKQDHLWFENSEKAAYYIAENKPQDSLILIKGSRGSKMEKILEALA